MAKPVIIIIDDDRALEGSLLRVHARSFPDHEVVWVHDGKRGVETVRSRAGQTALVVLDIAMPGLDGNLAAVQIRTLAPTVPVMPFSAHEQSFPALLEIGCVLPVLKTPAVVYQLPALMRQAMRARVAPMPELSWVAAMRQSGALALAHGEHDPHAAEQARRALSWINKYCGRFATPAREIVQARKVLEEIRDS